MKDILKVLKLRSKPDGEGNYRGECPACGSADGFSIKLDSRGGYVANCFRCNDQEKLRFAIDALKRGDSVAKRGSFGGAAIPGPTTVAALAAAKKLPADWLRSLGVSDGKSCVEIQHYDALGNEVAVHYRGADKFWWTPGTRASEREYGLNWLMPSERRVICEGESDVWTLLAHKYSAVGIMGATLAAALRAETVRGVEELFVIQEGDEPGEDGKTAGERFVAGVRDSLAAIGFTGKAYAVMMPRDAKDPSALHVQNPQMFPERFERLLKDAKKIELIAVPRDDFTFISLKDAFAASREDIKWRVDKLIASGGSLSLLQAKPKKGKSTFARTMALAIARGAKFLGRDTIQTNVAYFALEERRAEVVEHFRTMGATGSEPLIMHFGSVPGQQAFEKLRSAIIENKIGFAVIDPIAMLLIRYIDNLNDYVPTYNELEKLRMIAVETNCDILYSHHLGKAERDSGDMTLGSTALTAVPETILSIRTKGDARSFESIQRRAGVNIEPTTIRLNVVTQTVEVGAPVRIVKAENAISVVLEFLRKNPDKQLTIKEICSEMKIGPKPITASVNGGIKKGEITRTGTGEKGDPFKYQAVPGWDDRKLKLQVMSNKIRGA